MDLNFDTIYYTTVLAMKLNRSHPSIKRDRSWFMQFFILHGLFTVIFFIVINCIMFHDLKNNDISSTCRNGCLCVMYCVVSFNYAVMLVNQELLTVMIETMKQDYKNTSNLSAEEQKIVLEYVKKSKWVCKQWLMITIMGVALFPVKNFILYAYYYYIDDFKLVPVHEMTFPRIIEERKQSNFFVYLLTYIIIMYFGLYGSFMYAAFVPLGPIFILHSCARLEIIKKRVKDLFIVYKGEEANEKLKNIVRQIQYVYSFVEKIQKCFEIVYELTMKSTTIILPIAMYEVIEASCRGEILVEFLAFIIGGVLISSSPCYYSDLLMEKGEELRLAVYCSRWEVASSHSARSTLLVILLRALHPIAIRTMFRTVCLDALTELFQQSYAIFNLMCAMWK